MAEPTLWSVKIWIRVSTAEAAGRLQGSEPEGYVQQAYDDWLE